MNILRPIHLNDNWFYHHARSAKEDYSLLVTEAVSWIPLALLKDWVVTSSIQAGADWFRRTVHLEPVDACVNYILTIDRVPATARVFINGKYVGQAAANTRFEQDITMSVSLGDNIIALQLICSAEGRGGAFGHVQLRPVPCS